MIEIQHGCVVDNTKENTYLYTVTKTEAIMKDYQSILRVDFDIVTLEFTVEPGETPKIGDFIEAGRLVKRTKPKVNNDWRMWKDKDLYGNP